MAIYTGGKTQVFAGMLMTLKCEAAKAAYFRVHD